VIKRNKVAKKVVKKNAKKQGMVKSKRIFKGTTIDPGKTVYEKKPEKKK
jgi:hypothetical protein